MRRKADRVDHLVGAAMLLCSGVALALAFSNVASRGVLSTMLVTLVVAGLGYLITRQKRRQA